MAVNTERKDYQDFVPKWAKCRDVVSGEDAIKAAGEKYLPRLGGQESASYEAYKMRGMFYGGTARTKEALIGMVFRKEPTFAVPNVVEPYLQDVTLNDTPMETFAVTTLGEVLTVGRYGILVDFQNDEVAEQKRRPYWVPYCTEQIINWRQTMHGGDKVLTLVVLKETREQDKPDYGYEDVTRWRVLQLLNGVYTVNVWEKEKSPNAAGIDKFVLVEGPMTPTRRGATLDFIPFVIIGPTALGPDPQPPPLLELANVNLSLYRTETDLEHGAHWTALPTVVIIGAALPGGDQGAAPLKIGSGSSIDLPMNGDAKMLEFQGQGLGALEKRAAVKIERMAVLGARLIEAPESQQGNETVIGAQQRQTASHAVLKTIAKTTSQGLTRATRLLAWWMGATQNINDEAINMALNLAFDPTHVSGDLLKSLLLGVQSGAMSFKWFYHLMTQAELTIPDVTADEEWAQIQAETPPDLTVEPVGQPVGQGGRPALPAVRVPSQPVLPNAQRGGAQ